MDDNEPASTTGPQQYRIKIPNSDSAARSFFERERRAKAEHHKRVFIDMLGGRKAYEDFTLEKFKREWAPEAYDAAIRFDPKRENLFIWGPSLVGKTHLTDGIAHKFFDLGRAVFVAVIPELKEKLCILEKDFNFGEKKILIERMIAADVLVWHELGRESSTGRGYSTEVIQGLLFRVLERRRTEGRNGFLGDSNWAPDALGVRYGGSFSERIKEMCGPAGIIQCAKRIPE